MEDISELQAKEIYFHPDKNHFLGFHGYHSDSSIYALGVITDDEDCEKRKRNKVVEPVPEPKPVPEPEPCTVPNLKPLEEMDDLQVWDEYRAL